jgi:hypothetical protein
VLGKLQAMDRHSDHRQCTVSIASPSRAAATISSPRASRARFTSP